MAQITGAEAVVRMLKAHGVRHVFGLCGDTSLPFYDALATLEHGITHVLTRDERSASYMADGYARVSGRVGVCEGPSGGGATYILPGVAEANESSSAVLALTSDVSVSGRGRYTLTEIDQQAMFRPATKWNEVIDRADRIPHVFRTAFASMTTGRPGAAHLGLPLDVLRGPLDDADVWANPGLDAFPARRQGPDPDAIEAAADLIGRARRPVFVCGGGPVISGASAALVAIAELLEAAVTTTISGKGVIAEDHPLAAGVVGSNGGTPQTRAVIEEADLVVFVGCRAGSVTTEKWRHPAPGRGRVIHIDVDPVTVGANYRIDVAIAGDARLALDALLAELARRPGPHRDATTIRDRIAALRHEKFDAFRMLAGSSAAPILPERIVADLHAEVPEDFVLVADAGTPCPYFSAYFELFRTGRTYFSNRAHGALGYSMSAAIGASFARPTAKPIAVMGDGSFGFTVGELETIVRLRLPITMVVVSNSAYGWIKAGQKTGFGARYYSVDFDRTDHARVAEAYGVRAWRVEDPLALRGALRSAIAHDGPSLVDVIAQPLQDANAPVSEWIV